MYSPLVQGGTVCKWANDSQRLILRYFDRIHNSPSQLYHLALPFSPSSSWLHKYYTAQLLQVPKVIKGTRAEWGICSRTVSLGSYTQTLSYWNDTIAIGSVDGDIIILDAITGSQITVLPGHLRGVNCFTFSSDGKSFVSGGCDRAVKLWDVQTGGLVKTFYGHKDYVWSVSISADCTRIASGSGDKTICLWDIQTGKRHCVIGQQYIVQYVSFSLTDPHCIVSISDNKVWQWDINGHQIPLTSHGSYIAFSPDCTQFALCNGKVVTVQNSDSRAIVAEFHMANDNVEHCCFSPDSKLVAVAAGRTAYVWDITNPDPHPIETLVGHTDEITSLVFSSPSSLISASYDESIKFWQIGALPTDPVATDLGSDTLNSPTIQSVSLQAGAGIAISSDESGVVKTWDLSTGLCKEYIHTPAYAHSWRDAQLIDGRIIVAWYDHGRIHIWDTSKGVLLQIVDMCLFGLQGLRISGDGSKVLYLANESIQAWSIHTGELMGDVKLELEQDWYLDPLQMNNSRIWIRFKDSSTQGWDFDISGFPPVALSKRSVEQPCLDFIRGSWETKDPSWIKDTVTGKNVFQMPKEYAWPEEVQWDGQYLVASYYSGELFIMDFHHMCPH